MSTVTHIINETSAISSDYGKTILPKTLRGILRVRPGYRILWKSCKRKSGNTWILEIEVTPKQ
jgi:hypothetical protein